MDVAETKTGNTFAPQSVNLTLCGPGYVRMNVEKAQVCEILDRMAWHCHWVALTMKAPFVIEVEETNELCFYTSVVLLLINHDQRILGFWTSAYRDVGF